MKGKLVNEYSKANKNGDMQTNYVYEVSGTQEELAKFSETDSAKTIDQESGKNLWITSRYEGENVDLVITKANRCAVDTSEDRKIAALALRFGKAGEAILAQHIAKKMRKNAPVTAKESVVNNNDLDLDNLG